MPSTPIRGRRLIVLALALSLVLSACFVTSEGIFVVGPGLRTYPLASPEGLFLAATYVAGSGLDPIEFGPVAGMIIVAIATGQGFRVLDLMNDEELYSYDTAGNAPMFGVVAMSDEPQGSGYAGVVGFGSGGVTVAEYFGSGTSFDTPVEYGSSVTYDMYPAGGSIYADLVTKVQPSIGVRFLVNEPPLPPRKGIDAPAAVGPELESDWTISPELLPAANFTGELVSAFVADDDLVTAAPALVLTRGVTSNLYLDDRDGDAPVLAEVLGLDARKLRCVDTESSAGWLCAVSLFGADQLAILNWDGQTEPTFRGNVNVGDGPVGIDLKLLDSGDVAIVSTGFNDDSVTEVRVSNVGTLLATQARSAPGGCDSPGHAIYFEDEGGMALVGTCWNSGNYFVLRSVL